MIKYCNLWVSSAQAWLGDQTINNCVRKEVEWEQFRGLSVYIGLDFSTRQDITAISFFAPTGDDDIKYLSKTIYFIPGKSKVIETVTEYKNWLGGGGCWAYL